jgi:hypothetical protein
MGPDHHPVPDADRRLTARATAQGMIIPLAERE